MDHCALRGLRALRDGLHPGRKPDDPEEATTQGSPDVWTTLRQAEPGGPARHGQEQDLEKVALMLQRLSVPAVELSLWGGAVFAAPGPDEAYVAETDYGKVKGKKVTERVIRFAGIPFARGFRLPRRVAIVGPGRRPGPIEESVERARGS